MSEARKFKPPFDAVWDSDVEDLDVRDASGDIVCTLTWQTRFLAEDEEEVEARGDEIVAALNAYYSEQKGGA